MAELKTRPTGDDAGAFLAAIADDQRRADAHVIRDLLARITGEPPVMWGSAIVGFGQYVLRYDGGREIPWMVIGFSPRTANTTIYLSGGVDRSYAALLPRLGKHTTGKGCLYIKRLDDIDLAVLEEILVQSVAQVTAPEPG